MRTTMGARDIKTSIARQCQRADRCGQGSYGSDALRTKARRKALCRSEAERWTARIEPLRREPPDGDPHVCVWQPMARPYDTKRKRLAMMCACFAELNGRVEGATDGEKIRKRLR